MANDGQRPERPSSQDLPSPFDVVPASPRPKSSPASETESWRFGDGSCDAPLPDDAFDDDYDDATDDTLPLSILLPLQ